jgi:hypothetical protein
MRFGRNVGKAVPFREYAAAKAVYEDAAMMGRTVALLELVGPGEVKVLLLNGCKRGYLSPTLALQVSRALGGGGTDPFGVAPVPHDDQGDAHDDEDSDLEDEDD